MPVVECEVDYSTTYGDETDCKWGFGKLFE
jgi:hypothetical protein